MVRSKFFSPKKGRKIPAHDREHSKGGCWLFLFVIPSVFFLFTDRRNVSGHGFLASENRGVIVKLERNTTITFQSHTGSTTISFGNKPEKGHPPPFFEILHQDLVPVADDDLTITFPAPFVFFVYDEFRDNELSPYNLSAKLSSLPGAGNVNCEWALSTCLDDGQANPGYATRRKNGNADVVLADLALRYPIGTAEHTPFATRTLDPSEADVFLVPYAHDSHCKTLEFDGRCRPHITAMTPLLSQIFANLKYFHQNPALHARHLFFSSTDFPFAHADFIRQVAMRTTLGDLRTPECLAGNSDDSVDGRPVLCPDFVIPYLNNHPDFQPPVVAGRSESWWTTRPRNHSLTALLGSLGYDGVRDQFLEAATTGLFPKQQLAGLPVQIGHLAGGTRDMPREQATFDLYQDSIFCMILPGDGPGQKRFFDVIMSGCIPVVLVFDRYGSNNGTLSPDNHHTHPSWWDGIDGTIPKDATIRTAYPFPKGFFPDRPEVGIDYESFVVQIKPGNGCSFGCGHSLETPCQWDCLEPHLKRLIRERTEILRLRQNLRKVAGLFTYGLQENSFQSYDAFAVLLTQLGHVLQRMPPLQPNERAVT